MCKTSQRLTILVLGLLGGSCCRLIPATHPPYTIIGTVESVDPHGLDLTHKTGQRIRIAITPQTTVVRHGNPAEVTDIKIGMRIVVLYHFVDGALTADEVRLFRTATQAVGGKVAFSRAAPALAGWRRHGARPVENRGASRRP